MAGDGAEALLGEERGEVRAEAAARGEVAQGLPYVLQVSESRGRYVVAVVRGGFVAGMGLLQCFY